jgi:hypothetical protein
MTGNAATLPLSKRNQTEPTGAAGMPFCDLS